MRSGPRGVCALLSLKANPPEAHVEGGLQVPALSPEPHCPLFLRFRGATKGITGQVWGLTKRMDIRLCWNCSFEDASELLQGSRS